MERHSQHSNLFRFLAEQFADADLDGRSDEEVARSCAQASPADQHRVTIAEGRELLNTPNFPWYKIGDCANRYFETEAEAREWLTSILDVLEDAVRKTPKRDPCA